MRIKIQVITVLFLLNNVIGYAQDKRKDLFRLGLRGGYNLASLKLKGDNLPTSKSLSAYNFGAVIIKDISTNNDFEIDNKTVSSNMVYYFWTIKGREQVSKSAKKRILEEGK